jgi:hypothetical protein
VFRQGTLLSGSRLVLVYRLTSIFINISLWFAKMLSGKELTVLFDVIPSHLVAFASPTHQELVEFEHAFTTAESIEAISSSTPPFMLVVPHSHRVISQTFLGPWFPAAPPQPVRDLQTVRDLR